MNPDGRVALMVGAASGLARRSAIRWHKQGGVVMALDRDEQGLKKLREDYPEIHTTFADVSDIQQVCDAIALTESDLGPIYRVDNAAAIFPTSLALDTSLATFQSVNRINYEGLVNVSLTALAPMIERGQGVLVNYCSIAGLIPYMHLAAYSASKHAAVAFTEILFQENRHRGVKIICLCPPAVDTPLRDQATSKPQIVVKAKPMAVDDVLDCLDRAIARNQFWCLPSTKTRLLWWLRRFVPKAVWSMNRRIEGE